MICVVELHLQLIAQVSYHFCLVRAMIYELYDNKMNNRVDSVIVRILRTPEKITQSLFLYFSSYPEANLFTY